MSPFNAVGLELWSMTSDIFFDNFIICTDRAVADDWANDGWGLKKAADGAAEVRNKNVASFHDCDKVNWIIVSLF